MVDIQGSPSHKAVRMPFEFKIGEILSEFGYRRIVDGIYRAEWSTNQVEHFLRTNLYGNPKEFLSVEFGFRNLPSELFSVAEILKYGGGMYRAFKRDVRFDCSMTFSVGRLANWVPRTYLHLSIPSFQQVADHLRFDIEFKLLPVIRHLRNINDMLQLIAVDGEPCPWIRSNGAIRAALIVHLGRQLGIQPADIHKALQPYHQRIASALPKPADPTRYVERVICDFAKLGPLLN